MQSLKRGNIFGMATILLWSTLALFGVLAGNIPPFQLVSMSFSVAFLIGALLWTREKRGFWVHFRWPLHVWFVGVFGLFGYHFFYFMGIQHAPAIEANLLNYLWPLLIVLFSSLLPGESLKWYHIVGTFLGLYGAFLLVSKGQGLIFETQYLDGYIYALLCAIIWSSYSVISRLFGKIPTSAIGAFCLVTAILSGICHLAFESTVTPDLTQWIAVVALGLGPVGGCFFLWDVGVKRGDIQLLGALSYAAPLFSTILLIVFNLSEPNPFIWMACGFIVFGSIISSLKHFKKIMCKIRK